MRGLCLGVELTVGLVLVLGMGSTMGNPLGGTSPSGWAEALARLSAPATQQGFLRVSVVLSRPSPLTIAQAMPTTRLKRMAPIANGTGHRPYFDPKPVARKPFLKPRCRPVQEFWLRR